jgi:hypothetical protein
LETKKGVERKMTPELFTRIRDRVEELRRDDLSGAKIAAALSPDFTDFKQGTLETYVRACLKLSKAAIQYYLDGDISFTVLMEFGQSHMSSGEIDYYLMEFVDHGMTLSDAMAMKEDHRNKVAAGVNIMRRIGQVRFDHEAKIIAHLKKEFGAILPNAQKMLRDVRFEVTKVIKLFEEKKPVSKEQIDEVAKHLEDTEIELKKVIDLLPKSTVNAGEIHSDLFHKAYLLRGIVGTQLDFLKDKAKSLLEAERFEFVLGEHFEFLDSLVRKYFSEIEKYMSSDAWVEARRKEINHG